jgi:hypothetical protein
MNMTTKAKNHANDTDKSPNGIISKSMSRILNDDEIIVQNEIIDQSQMTL